MKSKKTLILVFALAMIATACSSAAVPCDEVEIGTGSNGLPDLDGCEFTFAVENASLQQRILVAAGNDDITSDADIVNGDGKVATQKGTTNYELAVSLFGEDKVDAYDTFDFAIAAVISGDAVASIVDEVAGLGYMGANKDKVKLVGDGLQTDPLGFAFPEGSPLVDVVNQGLAEMKSSGKLTEINDKFFSPGFTVSYDDIAECDAQIPEDYLPEDCEV